jgi:hypothetical protein
MSQIDISFSTFFRENCIDMIGTFEVLLPFLSSLDNDLQQLHLKIFGKLATHIICPVIRI